MRIRRAAEADIPCILRLVALLDYVENEAGEAGARAVLTDPACVTLLAENEERKRDSRSLRPQRTTSFLGGSVPTPETISPSLRRAPIMVDLALLGMAFIWGLNFTVVKTALAELSPPAFNALRFSLASLLIMVALWLIERDVRPAPEDGWRFLVLGLVGNTGYQFFFINGLHRTTSGNGSLILATIPIFVPLVGILLRIERVGARAWAGIALSFAGIVLIVLSSGEKVGLASETMVGNLMILGAAVLWASYTILSRPLLARYSPLKVTALAMLTGTPFIVLRNPRAQGTGLGRGLLAGLGWAGFLRRPGHCLGLRGVEPGCQPRGGDAHGGILFLYPRDCRANRLAVSGGSPHSVAHRRRGPDLLGYLPHSHRAISSQGVAAGLPSL